MLKEIKNNSLLNIKFNDNSLILYKEESIDIERFIDIISRFDTSLLKEIVYKFKNFFNEDI